MFVFLVGVTGYAKDDLVCTDVAKVLVDEVKALDVSADLLSVEVVAVESLDVVDYGSSFLVRDCSATITFNSYDLTNYLFDLEKVLIDKERTCFIKSYIYTEKDNFGKGSGGLSRNY